ncbi:MULTISPECIES: UDP-N-acetylmuramoyl-L-alanine--D-glutamate ligase [Pseudoalteromonas]|uniref:UDP-N-acetylmuramoylalanine--D-glutamate ligase n=1 Tax=Pseudoalteromonas obscura TaxID=3048491 RepID=A0ABT7ERB0_9GAMM|nr:MULTISPECIES: UDP-N-acetylmuramoyl-L-alanine--D-glutamate ligase [Pseudoalteromonas]MBQ4838246.1 UDP-N-acetylmuramoyl-L-alanine--D-glutamate ligase [Pseudoalteromonas luteoviolacea]MDK2597557.1 UDP-N-acetylmuramoyl-L-alanine--D-glutamate ligase [Pseudoalteromonas sp. P94(2023)]
MNYLDTLKQKKVTVLGLGISGLGTVRFLLRHGIFPKVVDTRPVPPGADWLAHNAPECEAVFGPLAEGALVDTDIIIISPGIPLYDRYVVEAIAHGAEVVGDIEVFARLNTTPVVAVTGSNGKSTVVSLAETVCQSAGLKVGLGGNIGTSVLDLLDQDLDIVILELSSFQLETTQNLKCHSAMILNITEDHMDRYPDFEAYCAAKKRIYQKTDLLVFNADDEKTHQAHTHSIGVGLHKADYCIATTEQGDFFSINGKHVFAVDSLLLSGKHNQFNALAVMALLSPFTIGKRAYQDAFSRFGGLSHRCQLIAEVAGVKYFNDSKATNVGATVTALESLQAEAQKIILILGGDAKGADVSPLAAPIQSHCRAIYCFGKDAALFSSMHTQSHLVGSLKDAVIGASQQAQAGDIVLLAPACASIDMYPNYMARGDEFCKWVGEL